MTRADHHELRILLFVAAVLAVFTVAVGNDRPDATSKPEDCTVHGSQR